MLKRLGTATAQRLCTSQVVHTLDGCVKELLDNALDAGATAIEVVLTQSGLSRIEVRDNGQGIKQSDFQSIAAPHSTSKIFSFDDIESSLSTFGYRGEALNALCGLCSSGGVTICTRSVEENRDVGSLLTFDTDGALHSHVPQAREFGTTITCTGLFTPIPVRRRQYEQGISSQLVRLSHLVQSYSIFYGGVRFVLSDFKVQKNNRPKSFQGPVLFASPDSTARRRVRSAGRCTTSLDAAQLPNNDTWRVEGYVEVLQDASESSSTFGTKTRKRSSLPAAGSAAGSSALSFYAVNNRPVEPLARIVKVVKDALHSFSSRKQRVASVFNIQVPKHSVDVNVTPDKRTVFLQCEAEIAQKVKIELDSVWGSTIGVVSQQQSSQLLGDCLASQFLQSSSISDAVVTATPGSTRASLPPPSPQSPAAQRESSQSSSCGYSPLVLPYDNKASPLVADGNDFRNDTPDDESEQQYKRRRITEINRNTRDTGQINTTATLNVSTYIPPARHSTTTTAQGVVLKVSDYSSGDSVICRTPNEATSYHHHSGTSPTYMSVNMETPRPQVVHAQVEDEQVVQEKVHTQTSVLSPSSSYSETPAGDGGERTPAVVFRDTKSVSRPDSTDVTYHLTTFEPAPSSTPRVSPGSGIKHSSRRTADGYYSSVDIPIPLYNTPSQGLVPSSCSDVNDLRTGTGFEVKVQVDMNSFVGDNFLARWFLKSEMCCSAGITAQIEPLGDFRVQRHHLCDCSLLRMAVATGHEIAIHDNTITECTATECTATECTATECTATECTATECTATECTATECTATECTAREHRTASERTATGGTATRVAGELGQFADDVCNCSDEYRHNDRSVCEGSGSSRRACEETCCDKGVTASGDTLHRLDPYWECKGVEAGFDKSQFENLYICGQFNAGFIVAALLHNPVTSSTQFVQQYDVSVYLIDQHASDEKKRFEGYNDAMKVRMQPLLAPMALEVSPAQERIIENCLKIFRLNGFDVSTYISPDGLERSVNLTALPLCDGLGRSASLKASGDTWRAPTAPIGKPEFYQLLSVLQDYPGIVEQQQQEQINFPNGDDAQRSSGQLEERGGGSTLKTEASIDGNGSTIASAGEKTHPVDTAGFWTSCGGIPRPQKMWDLLASRACRSAIMIGDVLSKRKMVSVVSSMGALKHPWNCPHGRPTMKRLVTLSLLNPAVAHT